jgi:hypothetical protein
MNMKNLWVYLIIFVAIIMFMPSRALAQDNTNILPLHTGKSYIIDFPVKVTRVVGGDPSAIELNLFKKEISGEELPGYQLLIAPIAERNTNIIVWTEAGIYVFDIVIDNSSPYTAETIIKAPADTKKFNIPVVEASRANIQAIEDATKGLTSQNTFEQNDYVEYPDAANIEMPESAINLDEPPGPDPLDKPIPAPINSQQETQPVSQPEKVQLPPVEKTATIPINISNDKPENKPPEVIDIPLKPQVATNYDVQSSLDTKTSNLYTGKQSQESNGLKLEINSVNQIDNSLVIHLTLLNTTSETRYLLWDLTKVEDLSGNRLFVRNQNLPPGIIPPEKKIKGDIIAYPKTGKQQLPTSGKIAISLLNTQGETIIQTEIPLNK